LIQRRITGSAFGSLQACSGSAQPNSIVVGARLLSL